MTYEAKKEYSEYRVFKSLDDYVKSIQKIGWINEKMYIENQDEKLIELGFPFNKN